MAKFKVGDIVKGVQWGWDLVGRVISVREHDPLGKYLVDWNGGRGLVLMKERQIVAANSRSVNSTRPIVQMALNSNRYTSWPYRGTFRVGQEVVMNPDAARVIHFMGPKVSKVTAVSKDGKTAVAFGGLEVTGMEACPRNEMELADKGLLGLNSAAPAGVVANAHYGDTDYALIADYGDIFKEMVQETEELAKRFKERFGYYSRDAKMILDKINKGESDLSIGEYKRIVSEAEKNLAVLKRRLG